MVGFPDEIGDRFGRGLRVRHLHDRRSVPLEKTLKPALEPDPLYRREPAAAANPYARRIRGIFVVRAVQRPACLRPPRLEIDGREPPRNPRVDRW